MNLLHCSQSIKGKVGKEKGMGLVEVLIASSIMAASLISIMGVYNALSKLSLRNTDSIQATYLAEEGLEIVRVLRDKGWANIASTTASTTYSFFWNNASSTWMATTSPEEIDIFDRSVIFESVRRNANFSIVQGGMGTVDPNSRKVTVTVSWLTVSGTSTKVLEGYVFNTFNK